MSDIAIKYANYAERRKMWVTPNEAKRLGVKGRCSSSVNSAVVQPASGLRERVCIFSAPNRFASLGVTQVKPVGFDGRFLTPLRCVRNDALPCLSKRLSFRMERSEMRNLLKYRSLNKFFYE